MFAFSSLLVIDHWIALRELCFYWVISVKLDSIPIPGIGSLLLLSESRRLTARTFASEDSALITSARLGMHQLFMTSWQ